VKCFLAILFLLLVQTMYGQTYNLWLVDPLDNRKLNKTEQTYSIEINGDTVEIYNDALKIYLIKNQKLVPSSVKFGEDEFIQPTEFYSEYPLWVLIIFKPSNVLPTRYWFHLNFEDTLQGQK